MGKPKSQKPNIIYILADDLGYGELGIFGQEKIETPNLDALAREGMRFTQHYSSAPVCAPARYMFLTGTHAGKAYIRGNHEWKERGNVWDYREMAKDSTLEGQHPMAEGTITLADRLKAVGYTTGLVGKWGLGAPHTIVCPMIWALIFFMDIIVRGRPIPITLCTFTKTSIACIYPTIRCRRIPHYWTMKTP